MIRIVYLNFNVVNRTLVQTVHHADLIQNGHLRFTILKMTSERAVVNNRQHGSIPKSYKVDQDNICSQ